MDRGAQRHDERRQFGPHAELHGLGQRHGDRRGGRLRSEGRHVGGEHRAEHLQRIFTRRKPRDGELHEKQHDRHAEDHRDQFHEDVQHPGHLPRLGHRQKDAENVEGQQRNDDAQNHQLDDPLEIVHRRLERHRTDIGHAQPQHEGEDQRRHHTHHGRHFDREIGRKGRPFLGQYGGGAFEQRRKEKPPRQIGPEPRKEREGIGQRGGQGQQTPGVPAQIGDARSHQPENQQRNGESQKLPENRIEGQRDARRPAGEEESAGDAQRNGQHDARQKSEFEFHKTVFW